jgi:tellurite resistance protein TerC
MGFNEFVFFSGFLAFIILMLLLDLGVLSRKNKSVSFAEASTWSLVWIVVALLFAGLLYQYGEQMHGVKDYASLEKVVKLYVDKDSRADVILDPNDYNKSVQSYRNLISLEFLTGWLLEYSLSIDNIFVIILIFSSFKVREKYYKKVLLWGVLGAFIMRFIFIFVGSALIHQFEAILYIFGGILIWSGLKMILSKEEENFETDKHPIVKLASRYFSVFPRYVADKFFVRRMGKVFITPLFLVILVIEFTDLLFAVDSVPAVFAVTKDPYLVFFSNIFAIMGLRSMFFFLSNVMHLFHYLKTGLSFLLMFIGLKMIVSIAWHEGLDMIGYKNYYSLFIILGILVISVVASLLFPVKEQNRSHVS